MFSLKMFSSESNTLYIKVDKTDIFSKNALYLKIQLHQDFFFSDNMYVYIISVVVIVSQKRKN